MPLNVQSLKITTNILVNLLNMTVYRPTIQNSYNCFHRIVILKRLKWVFWYFFFYPLYKTISKSDLHIVPRALTSSSFTKHFYCIIVTMKGSVVYIMTCNRRKGLWQKMGMVSVLVLLLRRAVTLAKLPKFSVYGFPYL